MASANRSLGPAQEVSSSGVLLMNLASSIVTPLFACALIELRNVVVLSAIQM